MSNHASVDAYATMAVIHVQQVVDDNRTAAGVYGSAARSKHSETWRLKRLASSMLLKKKQ